MTQYIAVNTVHYAENGKQKQALPGTPFVPHADDIESLLECGAIREPDEAEAALFALAAEPVKEPVKASKEPAKATEPAKAADKAAGDNLGL